MIEQTLVAVNVTKVTKSRGDVVIACRLWGGTRLLRLVGLCAYRRTYARSVVR